MLNPIVFSVFSKLDSWIAARNVHSPEDVAQEPFPGEASSPSHVELTTNWPGSAAGVGPGLGCTHGNGVVAGVAVTVGVGLEVGAAVGVGVQTEQKVGVGVAAGHSAFTQSSAVHCVPSP